jgi:hypothetical protein
MSAFAATIVDPEMYRRRFYLLTISYVIPMITSFMGAVSFRRS